MKNNLRLPSAVATEEPAGDACPPISELTALVSHHGMIGSSPAFMAVVRQIGKIALTDASVLLEGETGVGKELAARAIHYLSPRRDRPFVALNCGAIPESLIESELFGHSRGAFTDAKVAHAGVVSQANGGTLFLDEIDTLPGKGQVAVLRFLQDRRYRPVGQSQEMVSDGRIIAATNQPLQELVERGLFRSDLLYRLNIIRLRLPPLRERKTDIALLARHFVGIFCERYGLPARRLHRDTWLWMMRYGWPGNVRELESVIHRNVLLCDGDDLVFEEVLRERGDFEPEDSARYQDFQSAKAQAIAEFEREYLSRLLHDTHGNVSAAARLACKERRSLGKLLKKYGLGK